jgi:hypothetical protein
MFEANIIEIIVHYLKKLYKGILYILVKNSYISKL